MAKTGVDKRGRGTGSEVAKRTGKATGTGTRGTRTGKVSEITNSTALA